MRVTAAVGALLVFLGFWQAAAHETALRRAQSGSGTQSSDYVPPVSGDGGLLSPGAFPRLPDAGTHVS